MRRVRRAAILLVTLTGLPVLTSCASHSTFHAHGVPPRSLRMAEVVYLAPRSEILREPEPGRTSLYRNLLAAGIKDSEIQDGSVAIGRVYCCGGITTNRDHHPERAFA